MSVALLKLPVTVKQPSQPPVGREQSLPLTGVKPRAKTPSPMTPTVNSNSTRLPHDMTGVVRNWKGVRFSRAAPAGMTG